MLKCEDCGNYAYDEESGRYVCGVSLDMDEFEAFAAGSFRDCPYYAPGDEYSIVRKQN